MIETVPAWNHFDQLELPSHDAKAKHASGLPAYLDGLDGYENQAVRCRLLISKALGRLDGLDGFPLFISKKRRGVGGAWASAHASAAMQL